MMAAKYAELRLGTIGLPVWLMLRDPNFRRAPGEPLRLFAYVLNGLIAAAVAAGISLSFHVGSPDLLNAASGDLPLILFSFILCAVLALCCDDWVGDTMPPTWLRLAEAAGCAAAMALGIALVVAYLPDDLGLTTDQWTAPRLVMLFAFPSTMAFVIGACVPHIYRSAHRAATARRDEANQLPASASATLGPSATDASSIMRNEDEREAGDALRQHQGGRGAVDNVADRIRIKPRKRAAKPIAGSEPRDDDLRVVAVGQLVGEHEASGPMAIPSIQQQMGQAGGPDASNWANGIAMSDKPSSP